MTDDLDHRIVDALVGRTAARRSSRSPPTCSVSEATVRQRVARLTADGVMQITAVTNPLKLGYEVDLHARRCSVEKSRSWRRPDGG